MAEHRDRIFEDQDVVIDGQIFTGCSFRRCRMIFRGTEGGLMNANTFEDTQWVFDGPALITCKFLSAIYNGGSENDRQFVEGIFDQIRRGSG